MNPVDARLAKQRRQFLELDKISRDIAKLLRHKERVEREAELLHSRLRDSGASQREAERLDQLFGLLQVCKVRLIKLVRRRDRLQSRASVVNFDILADEYEKMGDEFWNSTFASSLNEEGTHE